MSTTETVEEKVLSKRRVGNFIYEIVAVSPSQAQTRATSSSSKQTPISGTKVPDASSPSPPKEINDQEKPNFHIPPHLMGRNIENPSEDLLNAGRRPQKPRLGVKIPYRNLTSQIVTHEEIAAELLQRSQRNRTAAAAVNAMTATISNQLDNTDKSDGLATKLTRRLANRLGPKETGNDGNVETADEEVAETKSPPRKAVSKLDPAEEKALALKQLSEFSSANASGRRRTKRGKIDGEEEPKLNGNNVDSSSTSPTVEEIGELAQNPDNEELVELAFVDVAPTDIQVVVEDGSQSGVASEEFEMPILESQVEIACTEEVVTQAVDEEEPNLGPPEVKVTYPPARNKGVRKRKCNELDRLLQDEGAINMLYETETPNTTTKKARSALKTREKIVKNAMLRLGATPKEDKVSTRSRKSTAETPPSARRRSNSSTGSTMEYVGSSPRHFGLPAEASRIIRRHSSSSEDSRRSTSPVVTFRRKDVEAVATSSSVTPTATPSSTPATSPRKRRGRSAVGMKKKLTKGSPKLSPAVKAVVKAEMSKKFAEAQEKKPKRGRSLLSTMPKKDRLKYQKPLHVEVQTKAGGKKRKDQTGSKSPSPNTKEAEKLPPLPSPNEETYNDLLKSLENESAGNKAKNMEGKDISKQQRSSPRQSENTFNFKEISVKKFDNMAQIILTPTSTKLCNGVNLQVLKEFSEALGTLKRDDTVRVVLVTSAGNTFCQGIDLDALVSAAPEKRKKIAEEMIQALKDFTKALGLFPKPLVAGVNGAAIGLGVTILPFFDIVYASDKATFCTPYAKLGQVPECAATLTFPEQIGAKSVNELLYLGKSLTASEALGCGLVTQVLWPAKFQEELIPQVQKLAQQSSQAMETTKILLRHSLHSKLDAALTVECHFLAQQWTSPECQQCIKTYLESEELALQRQRLEAS